MGTKGKGIEGDIVQVQGHHILRSTSQKDRHSKVYTAKGPRDRRVRLSAHTAIQFYDVQDRLGYDRPSKAVDWLIEKAKDAIDKLDGLPPLHPNDTSIAQNSESNPSSSGTKVKIQPESSFIQPESDTEFMNTMKSFFPTGSSAASLMNFQNFPHDMMSRASFQAEDLGLSLHTLQDQNPRPSTNPGLPGNSFNPITQTLLDSINSQVFTNLRILVAILRLVFKFQLEFMETTSQKLRIKRRQIHFHHQEIPALKIFQQLNSKSGKVHMAQYFVLILLSCPPFTILPLKFQYLIFCTKNQD
ncbi:unnamed protein product [Fraxinus pennsylvanica]|uniref:TCP domain-containing protein n=1 Tax=Fraxinus pennsylvanica TaxID=56036 RepID=A0AAD2DM60_9LAMI|nr:unnamed protein product [Fraxinus pennsylvanica]